jgi:hypothetical protein
MQAVKIYKTPSQLRGERYLRGKNLLVLPSTSTQRNIERVKLKARAIRLKEECKHKYLTRSSSSAIRRSSQNTSTVRALPEESIIVPDYIENTPSVIRRTLTFCIALWFSFLIAIAICILVGYSFF